MLTQRDASINSAKQAWGRHTHAILSTHRHATMDQLMQDLIDSTTKRRPVDYVALMSYLASRNAVPPIVTNPNLPEVAEGGFRTVPSVGPAGQVELRGTSPAYVGTLLHELTHAAQVQMEKHRQNRGAGKQFTDAYDKLAVTEGKGRGPGHIMSRRPQNPEWPEDYKQYRVSDMEAPAFAVGNQSSGIDPTQRAAPHVDTTLAQEFMILLDLATRDLIKSTPNSGGKK